MSRRPHHRWRRHALGALSLAVGLAVTGVGTPASAADIPASADIPGQAAGTVRTTATGAADPTGPAATAVTLPTGDRFTVSTTGGKPVYMIDSTEQHSPALATLRLPSGDQYAVPYPLLPHLGHGLDLSLFDLDALRRAGGGGRIPVRVVFTDGAAQPPAGLTLTSVQGTTGVGYLTPTFSDTLRAAATGAGPLFSGVASISLDTPGAVPPPVMTPQYALHPVTVSATDLAGRPAQNVFVTVADTDSMRSFAAQLPMVDGIAKVQLPAGHYVVLALFFDQDDKGDPAAYRLVDMDNLTVPASGAATTFDVDERASTTPLTFSTPRPSSTFSMSASASRMDSSGLSVAAGTMQIAPNILPFYVTPTPAAPHGRSRFLTQWFNIAPKNASPSYWYDAPFGSPEIPADGAYRITDANTATVRNHLYRTSDGHLDALGEGFIDPVFGAGALGFGFLVPAPDDAIQYLGAGDGGNWLTDNGEFGGDLNAVSDPVHYDGGKTYDVDWMRGPIAPQVGVHHNVDPKQSVLPCVACQAGDQLHFSFNLAGSDSDPAHAFIPGQSWSTHMTLSRDGTELGSSALDDGGITVKVPAGAATYRVVADTSRSPELAPLSTVTHTDLTFRTAAKPTRGNTLPDGESCLDDTVIAGCQILPVLNLTYDLPTDPHGRGTADTQSMNLTVDHLGYDGRGSNAPAKTARVEVSFDGGATWTQAQVTSTSQNHFRATWANSGAKGSTPWLRVTATDAIGGSITQTVTNAYAIG
ncbi:hypothetical protein [Kitasatospora brasiliensis]|uniref:hypothetical protein n=1 Tax=Kitasatospora brasiliensis TaxID=3058040 RepID=UPI002931A90D|nr:hypothetical protein [Kitasatospora sp. K002]